MPDELARYQSSTELRLEFELQQARTALEHTKRDLELLGTDVRFSHNANEEYQRALKRYSEAVNRFADFVLNGIVPRD